MTLVHSLLISSLLSPLSLVASADTVERYDAYADSLPKFKYADATADRPIRVTATSKDGKCHFTLSLLGYQQDDVRNVGMSGRIEQGSCNGRSVHKGVALGSVDFKSDHVVLERSMQVVVFD